MIGLGSCRTVPGCAGLGWFVGNRLMYVFLNCELNFDPGTAKVGFGLILGGLSARMESVDRGTTDGSRDAS